MGSFLGSLSSVPATKLGSTAIQGALKMAGLDPKEIEEVYMGNVLQAGMGQAPARQAALGAGLSESVPCTTINKVCASGMKAIALARATIVMGDAEIVIAGGMENMSQVPHYLDARKGSKFGDIKMRDGMLADGLTDVYNKTHMGNCAELCAKENNITREDQDAYAITSYKRSAYAWENGAYTSEVVPVEIPQRKGDPILFSEDEEAVNRHGLTPLAKIIGYADAAHDPKWFTTAPSLALPIALDRAGISVEDVDLWELNEAFAVVGIVNNQKLGLDPEKVNVNGGAVSLGHPLGSSGCRIVVTLAHALKARGLKYGAAGICNGGGGASALIIEAL
jgi:acetyl-CoA C-acetyltransferase